MVPEHEARDKFTEIPKRAVTGELQFAHEANLVVSRDETPTGKWLVKHLAGLGEMELPSREENRPSPFEGWSDGDFGE